MFARHLATIAVISLAMLAPGCTTGPQIRTDSDPTANLASYKTFAFFDDLATEKSTYTTMLTNRLKASTQRELERHGLSLVGTDPQLLVNFNVNIQDRSEVESTPTAGFYGYRAGMYGMWAGYPQDVRTTHYQEGTLVIDLVDAAKRQLVWQGIAEGRIHKRALDDPQAAIDQAVGEIFKKYPAGGAVAP